jgi:hypothetical protein
MAVEDYIDALAWEQKKSVEGLMRVSSRFQTTISYRRLPILWSIQTL